MTNQLRMVLYDLLTMLDIEIESQLEPIAAMECVQ